MARSIADAHKDFALRQIKKTIGHLNSAIEELQLAAKSIEEGRSNSYADTIGWAVDNVNWMVANASLGSLVIAGAQADASKELEESDSLSD
jgi:hypothetical protein